MSDDFGFAPPPFNPGEALLQLRRTLRGLKLSERAEGFELRGKRVLEVKQIGIELQVRVARRLALTPEWDALTLASHADQRKLVDEIKKRLARWERDE